MSDRLISLFEKMASGFNKLFMMEGTSSRSKNRIHYLMAWMRVAWLLKKGAVYTSMWCPEQAEPEMQLIHRALQRREKEQGKAGSWGQKADWWLCQMGEEVTLTEYRISFQVVKIFSIWLWQWTWQKAFYKYTKIQGYGPESLHVSSGGSTLHLDETITEKEQVLQCSERERALTFNVLATNVFPIYPIRLALLYTQACSSYSTTSLSHYHRHWEYDLMLLHKTLIHFHVYAITNPTLDSFKFFPT